MVKYIKGRLSKYYGGGPNSYEFLRSINIKTGTLRQPKGHFNRSQKNSEDDIYMIGEKVTNGSIEGAVVAGLNVIDEF